MSSSNEQRQTSLPFFLYYVEKLLEAFSLKRKNYLKITETTTTTIERVIRKKIEEKAFKCVPVTE